MTRIGSNLEQGATEIPSSGKIKQAVVSVKRLDRRSDRAMNKQLIEKLGIVMVLGLGAMLIIPLRYALVGLVKHERFYQLRPTSYWLKMLKDNDARYRRWAARSLGELGLEPGVVPALIEALKDKDPEVHCLATTSLGAIGPAANEAVPVLIEALTIGDDYDRKSIEEALKKIDPMADVKAGVRPEP